MIKTRKRHVLISSDYSSQEVKILAQMCDDRQMIELFEKGMDFYSDVASKAFKKKYEDCLEFPPKGAYLKKDEENPGYFLIGTEDDYDVICDGSQVNKQGKNLRSQAKSVLLGIMYGRGEKSIAEQIGETEEEAKKLKEDVYKALPKLQEFEQKMYESVREKGYLLTLWNYKRRLPEFNLPDFELTYVKDNKPFPPIFASDIINTYSRLRYYDKIAYEEKLLTEEGIKLKTNFKEKARASRQIVNSAVQGSAAQMSKLAMIALLRNEELKSFECYPLIPVHDEIIAVAPYRYAKPASELFVKTMEEAPSDKLEVYIKCDAEIYFNWAGKSVELLDENIERA